MASLGQALREEREGRGISLEEVASSTKIVLRYLEALEADRLDRMPGGFFVRGIIRGYAKAVGLDPDEVLNRYKAAGMLEPAEAAEKRPFPLLPSRPAARVEPAAASPPTAPPAPPAPPRPAAAGPEPALKAEEPPAIDKPSSAVLIDEAPKPRLSAADRRRILAWAWRGLAAVLLVIIIILIWPRGGRDQGQTPSGQAPAGAALKPPPAAADGTGLATAASSEPAAAPGGQDLPQPIPVVEKIPPGLTIEIEFQAETWIHVRTDGEIKIDGIFPPGSTARARADSRLLIHTGNAGGFTFRLNGRPAKPLGRSGQVLTDVKITLENIGDFLEPPSTEPPTG